MDRASSSSAGATPPDLDGLLDELAISRTILASLQEGPQDSDTPRQISAAKKDVARLQKDISRARGNTQGPTCPPPPPRLPTFADPETGSKRAANSNGTMQWYRQDDYAGEYSSEHACRDLLFAARPVVGFDYDGIPVSSGSILSNFPQAQVPTRTPGTSHPPAPPRLLLPSVRRSGPSVPISMMTLPPAPESSLEERLRVPNIPRSQLPLWATTSGRTMPRLLT